MQSGNGQDTGKVRAAGARPSRDRGWAQGAMLALLRLKNLFTAEIAEGAEGSKEKILWFKIEKYAARI
jgi:hypothetical protein